MKVHDYSYLTRLNELIKSLKGSDNKVLKFIDGQDTAISEKTWEAALVACGAAISAIDNVV